MVRRNLKSRIPPDIIVHKHLPFKIFNLIEFAHITFLSTGLNHMNYFTVKEYGGAIVNRSNNVFPAIKYEFED